MKSVLLLSAPLRWFLRVGVGAGSECETVAQVHRHLGNLHGLSGRLHATPQVYT